MVYRNRDLGGGAYSSELTYPRTKEEVYGNIYDVRKTQTINEDTPFTTKVGQNFVQIIPSEALIEHKGQVVPLGSVYKPEDLRQDVFTGKIGQAPDFSNIDMRGANQNAITESLITGGYQVQNPKGTISGAMSFGSQEYRESVKFVEDVKFQRWYGSLSDQEKWNFEAKVVVGTALLTMPVFGAGLATLPRAIQLGVAYGSSAYMSYDIVRGTSQEGIGYLGKPEFVIGVPLSIAGGYIGFKFAQQAGIAGAFGRPEVVRPTQEITGVREIGDNIFRGNVEVKYGLGGGLRGTKQLVIEKYDVILSGEKFQTPMARLANFPTLKSPVAIAQTGRLDVLVLGGSRTVTSRNFLGAWSKVTKSPISPSQSNLVLFNQAEGTAELPTFTAKAQYAEIASPNLKTKLFGKSLSFSTAKGEATLGLSREIAGKFDIRTVSLGAGVNLPASEPIIPSRFKPTFSVPKSNVYLGLGDLSNQPLTPKTLGLALGQTPVKAIPLTTSDKSFIGSLKGSTGQVQQSVLTKTEAIGTLQAGSFARPSSVSRTSVFDFMPKMTLPSFKTGRSVSQFSLGSPITIEEPVVTTKRKSSIFSVPNLNIKFAQQTKQRNELFPMEAQIQIPATKQRNDQILALGTGLKLAQKQRTAEGFSFGGGVAIPKIPPIKIPIGFPSLSISLGGGKLGSVFKGMKTQYQPTLIAKEFKIFGKQPKFITGLEVRPMLRSSRKKKSRR